MNQDQMDIQESFFRVLVEDVMQARSGAAALDTASNRRNLLRTIISAVEGLSWVYRTHVQSIANDLDLTTPLIELAFSETSYFVTDTGKLVEQTRFVSTTAMIRLATKVAKSISREVNVDFGSAEWGMLKEGIRVRNRITHPKSNADMAVSVEDIKAAERAFCWLLAAVAGAMNQTVKAHSAYSVLLTEIVEDLNNGDPETLARYRRLLRDPND